MSSKSLGDLVKAGSAPAAGDLELDDGIDYRQPRGDVCTDLSLKELSATDNHGVARGTYAQEKVPSPKTTGWLRFLVWEGGTGWDAFFTCASAQVGQVILSLPHSLAQTGMVAGILLMLLFASLAMWTVYLMVVLYLDNKSRKIKEGTWYNDEKKRSIANQYHEVMAAATNKWLGIFSRVVVIIALGGLAVAQIIASSSNFHRMIPELSKRDWALVFGGVAMCMSLIPNFRNFRLFSFIALVATTFTSWYMVAMGIKGSGNEGLKSQAWTDQTPSAGWEGFFAGASNIIFTFGGHAMLLEVMDSMFKPYKFHKVFYGSYLYVYTLVLPNSMFIFWGWPEQAAQYGNVYAYMPASVARDISIVLMVAHQVIVFGLFAFPIFFMVEKWAGVHNGAYWKRLLCRLPIAALLWLISLAFPFFGVINDVLGAFTTTFETFIIPCLAYNWHYQFSKNAEQHRFESTKPPTSNKWLSRLGGWRTIFYFNWVIIVFTAVFGFGMGGYASIKAFVESIQDFGVFAACYNC
ncbi:hypothetical protein COHA_002864 [Chlorella ohadii]|uniref:Amino acid transporter transmembrane domain-containing protein n=1 Tax=Chlorella ohadii TaxID=2649997 RepID=A0AAD5DWC0_9CHLO|nr:hypothetical protein COHA_002864 [Chlorella ohadii]